jgi:hypothetical protein
MSNFKETLIDIVEYVIDRCRLSEEQFNDVQEIILDNELPLDKHEILTYFLQNKVCPQCYTLNKTCQCISIERL